MWDLAEDLASSIALIEDFYSAGKPVAAVCHERLVCSIVSGSRVNLS